MAKFLISTMPATGHVNPMLPVATALIDRGHDVWWHTGRDVATKVQETGARFVAFDRSPDFAQIPVISDPGTTGLAAGASVLRRLFIDRIPGQVADYESILRDFNADVVLVDVCSLGAATLYDRNGPIFATLGINPLVTEDPEIPPWGSHRPPAARLCPDWQVGYVEVDELLRQAVRASSAGEGVNSVVRMHPGQHRHVSQEMLDLKRLYWNC